MSDDFAPPAHDDYNADLESPARSAAILGVIGLTMHAMMCCTSIFGSMVGTVLGGVAFFMAKGILEQDPRGEALAYGNVGYWTGIISMIWGTVIAIAITAYIGLYVVLFGVIIASGA